MFGIFMRTRRWKIHNLEFTYSHRLIWFAFDIPKLDNSRIIKHYFDNKNLAA